MTDPLVEAGRVGRPHGLDGAFHVTGPDPDLLPAKGATVRVAGTERVVERRGGTGQRPTLRLSGVTSRPEADALRGEGLWVPRDDAALQEDEWWAADLVGLAVRDGNTPVGVVEAVRAYPSCEVLVVGERLIPLIDDAVRSVDVEGGVVDVDLAFLGEDVS